MLVSGAVFGWFFAILDGWSGWTVAAAVIVLLVGSALVLAIKRPDVLARWLCWLPAHLFYRINVVGREHIPRTGGVLFVCNHVSYIDALLVFMAQRRLIRFIIWAPFTRTPVLRQLLKLSRVIPIDGTAGPRAVLQALHAASDALNNGEAVCIFAEGGITRTGFLLPFHRGMEQILKKRPRPGYSSLPRSCVGQHLQFPGGQVLHEMAPVAPLPRYHRLRQTVTADDPGC